MIPVAEATGRCEIRPNCYVHRLETDKAGRVTGAVYFDAKKNAHLQRAKAVVVCSIAAAVEVAAVSERLGQFQWVGGQVFDAEQQRHRFWFV